MGDLSVLGSLECKGRDRKSDNRAGQRGTQDLGQIDSLGTTNGEPVRSLVGLARGVVRLIRGAVGGRVLAVLR